MKNHHELWFQFIIFHIFPDLLSYFKGLLLAKDLKHEVD